MCRTRKAFRTAAILWFCDSGGGRGFLTVSGFCGAVVSPPQLTPACPCLFKCVWGGQ